MGKKSDFSIIEKTKALAWRDEGVGTKEIGQRLGRSQRAVKRLLKRAGQGVNNPISTRKSAFRSLNYYQTKIKNC